MQVPMSKLENAKTQTVRASVSFSANDYAELELIAAEKRVSVAWVVRDAVGQYLAARNPLFRPTDASRQTE
jgi:hypothetical protein